MFGGRELVRRVQDKVNLARPLSLVVIRSGQGVLEWSAGARDFAASTEWDDSSGQLQVRRIQPNSDIAPVVIDPLRGFGDPTVRGVRTEVIAELIRAGETPAGIAEMYDLEGSEADAAVRYELLRLPAS